MTMSKKLAPMLVASALLLAACAGAPAPQPEIAARSADSGFSESRLGRIGQFIESQIAEDRFPGAVVHLERHGEVALHEAWGLADLEGRVPMRTDTLFRMASMSKPVTSTAVMILFEDGHFLLDDPVGRYLPEFDREMQVIQYNDDGYELVAATAPITIRHLLSHTSGISYRFIGRPPIPTLYAEGGINDGIGGEDLSLESFSQRLAAMPLAHQPGEGWTYGLNTDVLGRLVEVVSGQTFDEFLNERLFAPLGMQDTFFAVPQDKHDRVAKVYQNDEQGRLEALPGGEITEGNLVYTVDYPFASDREYLSGGGGLVSTASDYARFVEMLLNGGELDGQRILSPKTIELMFSDQAGSMGQQSFGGHGFGLGFSVDQGPGVTGSIGSAGIVGWSGLFSTFFWIDPEEDLFAILLTQHLPFDARLAEEFRVQVYQSLIGE